MKQFIKYILPLLLVTTSVMAQEIAPPPPGEGDNMMDERRMDPAKIKEFKAKIEAKIIQKKHEKIREVLTLDDAQAKSFFDKYLPAEKEMIVLVKERNEAEIKLLKLTQGNGVDGDVDPTIAKIKDLNGKIQDRYEKLDGELKQVLNPRQRAKLLVFEREFNRKVREKVREMRQNFREKNPDFRPRKRDIPLPPGPGRIR